MKEYAKSLITPLGAVELVVALKAPKFGLRAPSEFFTRLGTVQGGNTFVLCHRGGSRSAVAKAKRGGGRTQANEAASQIPLPKPAKAAAEPAFGSAPAERHRVRPRRARHRVAEDAHDTKALWESQPSRKLQWIPGAPLGVLG